jgi:AcrR family transcriptional regulator
VDTPIRLTIGQLIVAVTRLTGIHCTPAMIYHYERRGLLDVTERTEGGYRLFELADVERVACIKRWQAEGMTLKEIGDRLEEVGAHAEEIAAALEFPEDRRTQILSAAAEVFPQKGYEATTVLDIAEKAEISTGAIYQYFPSKKALFLAFVDHYSFGGLLQAIDDMLEVQEVATGDDVHRTLVEVGRILLEAHTENLEVHRLFLSESRSFPEVGRKYYRRLIAPVEALLSQFIFDRNADDILRDVDPKVAVHAFYGMFASLYVTQNLVLEEGFALVSEEERIEQLVDIYLDGMLKR